MKPILIALALGAVCCFATPALADGHMDDQGICWAEKCVEVWVYEKAGPNQKATCVKKRVFFKVPVDCPECECETCHYPKDHCQCQPHYPAAHCQPAPCPPSCGVQIGINWHRPKRILRCWGGKCGR